MKSYLWYFFMLSSVIVTDAMIRGKSFQNQTHVYFSVQSYSGMQIKLGTSLLPRNSVEVANPRPEVQILGERFKFSAYKKDVLRNFVNFTEKHLYRSLFLIEMQAKRLKHRCFPAEFTRFLKTYERLLLKSVVSPGVYFLISTIWLKLIHGFCIIIYSFCYNQQQSSGGVLQKKCSYEFCKIHKKNPALGSRF